MKKNDWSGELSKPNEPLWPCSVFTIRNRSKTIAIRARTEGLQDGTARCLNFQDGTGGRLEGEPPDDQERPSIPATVAAGLEVYVPSPTINPSAQLKTLRRG